MSVFEILQGAKFAEGHVDICLRGDLDTKRRELISEQARIARALNQEDNERLGRPKLNKVDEGRAQEIEEELQAVEDEMAANVLTFHMRGVSTGEYGVLQRTAGRPRKENQTDKALGYNIQAFFEKAMKRCTFKVSAPDGSTATFEEEHWDMLFKSVNDAQFDLLCQLVDKVNRKVVSADPTKSRSSSTVNGSESKPEQLMDLESAISALPDGSQPNEQE